MQVVEDEHQGLAARIYYRFADLDPSTEDFNQTFRGSSGVSGWVPSRWGSEWKYDASFVGMTDDHSVLAVTAALVDLPRVMEVTVDLDAGTAEIVGLVSRRQVQQAVHSAGYRLKAAAASEA